MGGVPTGRAPTWEGDNKKKSTPRVDGAGSKWCASPSPRVRFVCPYHTITSDCTTPNPPIFFFFFGELLENLLDSRIDTHTSVKMDRFGVNYNGIVGAFFSSEQVRKYDFSLLSYFICHDKNNISFAVLSGSTKKEYFVYQLFRCPTVIIRIKLALLSFLN